MPEIERRRRRLRPQHSSAPPSSAPPQQSSAPPQQSSARPQPQPQPPVEQQPEPPPAREESERGLRGLVGSGSSQVSVTAALRARDAARPSDEQIAEAEQHLTIVRRNWTPREDLPRNR